VTVDALGKLKNKERGARLSQHFTLRELGNNPTFDVIRDGGNRHLVVPFKGG